ncbi:hypothetical protein AYK25_01515 [Thermoplasmatales archaeon SM1-50]|nr:MAG: hypothetical protein AYK25_01515 [Thermoplasmatales archaeon SM1-50]
MRDEKKVPECVQIGDLLLLDMKAEESNPWKRPGLYNEHAAIYIGNNSLVDATSKFVRVKDYSHYYYNWTKNLAFLRVKTANEKQRKTAAEWAKNQIGLAYQVFFDIPWFGLKIANTNLPFPTAHQLYCMELPWIAYYRLGIDIDRNGWRLPCWVTGNDIIFDDDIEVIYREVQNSTEFVKPYKGVYIANKQIAYTLNHTIIFGTIDIEVITANLMITHMDFYIDNTYKSTDTTPPYCWRWDERGSGRTGITAVAYVSSGNHYSTTIMVWKIV